jgi:UDPglucose 6-dehydrogenase
MHVAVVGTGYVGLVAGACFAETGNDVVCADIDEAKIAQLQQNDIPIYEPGLETLVRRNQDEGRLRFTTDVGAAVETCDVIFIAVGTPPDEDGSADLQHVLDVARTIGRHLTRPTVVVTKSTVPVETAETVSRAIKAETDTPFYLCSNPEFLKEGNAVEDFMKPDRVVIGVDSEEARDVMGRLYDPFVRTGNPVLFMDIASAEVTKYAANAMLASRISFMNQVAQFCELVGADIENVRHGIATDRRIGSAFLFPSPGYGGSCFPKDVKALIRSGKDKGMDFDLLQAVEDVNARQKQVLFAKLRTVLGDDLSSATVAVWGLSFKAETDDMRESPAIPLIEALIDAGATVRAHDPKAEHSARMFFGDRIYYASGPYDAVDGADALVIVTEWLIYRNPDFERILSLMRRPAIIDGRNLFEPGRMRALGIEHHGIGRRAP